MRLLHTPPAHLVGRTIQCPGFQWWLVEAIDHDTLLLSRNSGRTRGKLRIDQLAQCRVYPTWDEVTARYPRLIRSMRWGAILTPSEAIGAVHGYLVSGGGYGGSEAIVHFGGVVAALEQAWRCRTVCRQLYARERAVLAGG